MPGKWPHYRSRSRRDRSCSPRSESRSRSPSHSRPQMPDNSAILHEMKEMRTAIGAEFKLLNTWLESVEKRVAENEGRARSWNLRVYGLDKSKVSEENPLPQIILHLFTDGFQVPDEKAQEVLRALDTYHWTNDKALILAFSRRLDLRFIKSFHKNLADYKPHSSLISIKDDLEPGQLAVEKECHLKFKALKTAHPTKNYKIVSFNRIACDQVVKFFYDW